MLLFLALCLFVCNVQGQTKCSLCSDLTNHGCAVNQEVCCFACDSTIAGDGICTAISTSGTPTCRDCATIPCETTNPPPPPSCNLCDKTAVPPSGTKCCPSCGSNEGHYLEVCPTVECAAVPPPCPTVDPVPCDICHQAAIPEGQMCCNTCGKTTGVLVTKTDIGCAQCEVPTPTCPTYTCDTCKTNVERNGCPVGYGCCGSTCVEVPEGTAIKCPQVAAPLIADPNPSVCDPSCESSRSCACKGGTGKYCLKDLTCRTVDQPCPDATTPPPPPPPPQKCNKCPSFNLGCPEGSGCCSSEPCSNEGVCSRECNAAACFAPTPCPESCPEGYVRSKCGTTSSYCAKMGEVPVASTAPCPNPVPPPPVRPACDLCPKDLNTARKCESGMTCCAVGTGACFEKCPETAPVVDCAAPPPTTDPEKISCNTATDCPSSQRCCCGGPADCLARSGYCSASECGPCIAIAPICAAPNPCTDRPATKDGRPYCPPDGCADGKSYWDESSCKCITVCPNDPCTASLPCGDCRAAGSCVYTTAKTADGFIGRCRASTNTAEDLAIAQVACPTQIEKVDTENSPVLAAVVPGVIEECLASFFDSIKTSCRSTVKGVAGNDEKAQYVIDFVCVAEFLLDERTKEAIAKCLEIQVPKQTDHQIDKLVAAKKRQVSSSSVQVDSSQPSSSPSSGLSTGAIVGIVIGSVAGALLLVAIIVAVVFSKGGEEKV